MAIAFASDCRVRLCACLIESLKELKVSNNWFIAYPLPTNFAALDGIPPRNVQAQLEKYIGEQPLRTFLQGAIARDLQIGREFKLDQEEMFLPQIEGFEDIEAAANLYLLEIESLPYEYMYTFPLSRAIASVIKPIGETLELADDVSIVFGTAAVAEQFPLNRSTESPSGNSLSSLLFNAPEKWEESLSYIQVRRSGFVGKFTTTVPEIEAISFLRSICGLTFAERAWKVGYSSSSAVLNTKYFVHKKIDGVWQLSLIEVLDKSIAATLDRLVPDDLEGTIGANRITDWLKTNLSDISETLKRADRSGSLLLAAQWHFDSQSAEDALLSFISASVVAEILLGNKAVSDKTGVTELLANRCAYLISRTHIEREKVLKDFREIYDVRSRIVHQGKRQLARFEREMLHKLQWMCDRIIQEESILLRKS